MQTVQIRDLLEHQRMFDLAIDSSGDIIIIAKIDKHKVTTSLKEVLSAAKLLKPNLAI